MDGRILGRILTRSINMLFTNSFSFQYFTFLCQPHQVEDNLKLVFCLHQFSDRVYTNADLLMHSGSPHIIR